jgi:hypothetical protein
MKSTPSQPGFSLPAPRLLAAAAALVLLAAGAPAAARGAPDEPPPLWFPVGEELVFRIYWGFVPVGASRIKTGWVERDGKRLLRIRYRARTNRLFNRIYPVDDVAETLVDPGPFLPQRFVFRMKRRGRATDDTVQFDHEAGRAVLRSRHTGTNRTFAITRNMRDIITFLYMLRADELQPGTRSRHRFVDSNGVVDMELNMRGYERVSLPLFGKVESLRVEPRANFAGVLIEEGKVTAWCSHDARRLLTRMTVDGPLANVNIVLCQVHGPGDDAWARKTRESGVPRCVSDLELAEDDDGPPPPAAAAAQAE